jgi:hypothetical protein
MAFSRRLQPVFQRLSVLLLFADSSRSSFRFFLKDAT